MNEIEHEGKMYILKSQVESIVKERVSKVAQRASEYESHVERLEKDLAKAQKANATVDILRGQVEELQSKYDKANQRFDRYTSISAYGLTDPEMIEGIEWAYDRAMAKSDKKIELGDWLKNAFENPDQAPYMLRPHIEQARSNMQLDQEVEDNPNIERAQLQDFAIEEPQNTPVAPKTNQGAVSLPDRQTSLSNRVYDDIELYEANREQIRNEWYKNRRKRG